MAIDKVKTYVGIDPGPSPGCVVLRWSPEDNLWVPSPLVAGQWIVSPGSIEIEIKALIERKNLGGVVCEDWLAGPSALATVSVDTIKQIGGIRDGMKWIGHGDKVRLQAKTSAAKKLRTAGLERHDRRDDSAIRWAVGVYYDLPGKGQRWGSDHAPFDQIAKAGHSLQALGAVLAWVISEEGFVHG